MNVQIYSTILLNLFDSDNGVVGIWVLYVFLQEIISRISIRFTSTLQEGKKMCEFSDWRQITPELEKNVLKGQLPQNMGIFPFACRMPGDNSTTAGTGKISVEYCTEWWNVAYSSSNLSMLIFFNDLTSFSRAFEHGRKL